MDRSLEEIISERPVRKLLPELHCINAHTAQARGGGNSRDTRRPAPPRAPRREEGPRDGVRKVCHLRLNLVSHCL
jgi:THO complex subunit 4